MIGKNRVIAIIPARGGSKSIPKKNLCFLNGKPLLAWTLEVAKKTEAEGKTVTRKLKRRTRRRTQLVAPPNTSLTTDADYSPIRNPRDGDKMGSA